MKNQIFFILFFINAIIVKSQTNIQVLYDLGEKRDFITTTLEMFRPDKWGNTFFFVDVDFDNKSNSGDVISPSIAYMEIARCFNFWQKTKYAPLSLQVEYNGGVGIGYPINSAYLCGVDYFVHNSTFSARYNLKVLYKYIEKIQSNIPLQLTFVWGMDDLLGVDGLHFLGFADLWWEKSKFLSSRTIFMAEPQLWYNVGKIFACPNLFVGGELEIAKNFSGNSGNGWYVNPCLGVKWDF